MRPRAPVQPHGCGCCESAAYVSHSPAHGEQIESELQTIAARFDSEEAFRNEFDAQGLTDERSRGMMADSLAIQRYLETIVENTSIKVSQEETATRYEQYQAQHGSLPPLEGVESMLVAEVRQAKVQVVIQRLVRELEAQSDIQVLLQR